MKALLLAAGKGTRLRPLTNTTAKPLLPVANKPILYYAIDRIMETGIADIGIVVSPETHNPIKQAVGDGSRWGARVSYILQSELKGIAHAVKTAREFLTDSSFLLFLSDNLFQGGVKDFFDQFCYHLPDALILLKEVPDPRGFGVAELDEKGGVLCVEEKPKQPKTKLILVGVYFFSAAIHEAIAQIEPSQRGELEITDAIQRLIDTGKRVQSHILEGWWLDAGKKDDLLEANRLVLDELPALDIQGQINPQSHIQGKVEIKEGTIIENSHIQGPVSIAERCLVKDSFIGAFTSIGRETLIQNSSVEHSIILEGCHISGIGHLTESIIGKRAELAGAGERSKAIRLFIGDDSRMEL